MCRFSKKLILLIFISSYFIVFAQNLFGQENATTFFGPYYRTNQYLPILIHQQSEFNALWVENKYTKDSLVFNQNKVAEALIKIYPDGTRLELVDKKGEKKILNFTFRILAEETPLIIIAGQQNLTQESSKEKYQIHETNTLPSNPASYEMIDCLIIKDSYDSTITPQQTEAIKEWVLTGGVIIFESAEALKKNRGLAAPLLKQAIQNKTESTDNDNLLLELSKTAQKISDHEIVSKIGYGYFGIKKFPEIINNDQLRKYCDGQIEWRIRNRNNSLSEKNSLRQEISNSKIEIIQKITLVYFFIFMIFIFLKQKKYFTRIACFLAVGAIIPAVLFTPSNQLDSHYYQMLEKNEKYDFSLLKEEVFFSQGNLPKITLKIDNFAPFFANDDAKIILSKNQQGQYIEQTFLSNKEYFSLKKTSLTKNSFVEKIKKENNLFFYHKFQLDSVYEVSEQNAKSFNFNIENSSQKGLITKVTTPLLTESRDNFDKKTWYATSNQIFNATDNNQKSIYILEGTTKAIPLDISPSFNIQKSFFTYLIIEN